MTRLRAVAAKCCLLSFAAIVLLSPRLLAQIPSTHAGRVLTAWLDALNSGDRAKLKAFLDVSAPDLPLDQVMGIGARSGGYDLRKIQDSKDREISALVQERAAARQFLIMTLVLDSDASDRANIRLRPT